MLEMRGGDELALDELMTRKTQPLVQYVFRMLGDLEEARDVTQLTFFKVWQKRCDYNPALRPIRGSTGSRPTFPSISSALAGVEWRAMIP